MKTQISNIFGFEKFYNEVKGNNLPLKVAYGLAKINAAIPAEKDFYNEKLQSIINEYGLKDDEGNIVSTEDGNGVQLIPGKQDECYQKIHELDTLEIDLPNVTLHIDDFGDTTISPDVISAIIPFLSED